MHSLNKYLFRPLEVALIAGLLLVACYSFLNIPEVQQAWLLSLIPFLLYIGIFTISFLVILFITWISCSTTEM